MAVDTLEKLFVHQLKDLYSAEKQLLQALPNMAKNAVHEELRVAFETHRDQTEEHVSRLEQIFEELGTSPRGKKCKGMEGLIEESKEVIEEEMDPNVRDAAMIATAQRVEHYEISGYGTVRTFAERLGHDRAAQLLQKTLDEEAETDELLTRIAESQANPDSQA
jgi:ferritin-like metal-binding protein YciE